MRKCFGHCMREACAGHHDCEDYLFNGCLSETNIRFGPCNCEYKASCHILRQKGQAKHRLDSGSTIESCSFYRELKVLYDN